MRQSSRGPLNHEAVTTKLLNVLLHPRVIPTRAGVSPTPKHGLRMPGSPDEQGHHEWSSLPQNIKPPVYAGSRHYSVVNRCTPGGIGVLTFKLSPVCRV